MLCLCGRYYTEREFERYFRRIYQHFGSIDGYEPLEDAGIGYFFVLLILFYFTLFYLVYKNLFDICGYLNSFSLSLTLS